MKSATANNANSESRSLSLPVIPATLQWEIQAWIAAMPIVMLLTAMRGVLHK